MSKQFAEFRVGDLFDVDNLAYYDIEDVSNGETTPLVSTRVTHNGYQKFSNENKKIHQGNSITLSAHSAKFFYQPVPFICVSHMYSIKHNKMNTKIGLYLVCAFTKATSSQFNFSQKLTGKKFSSMLVYLPVIDATANTPNPEPDWEYMENYIKTIEQKYIDQIAGINTREQQVLAQLHSRSVDVEPVAQGYADFRVGDVFETVGKTYTGPAFWSTPEPRRDNLLLPPMPAGSTFIPLITGSTTDNGISGWAVSTEHIDVSPCISIAPHSGYVALQRSFVAIGRNAYAIRLLHANFSLRSLMYCVCVLQKLLHVGVDYSNLASWDVVKDKIIQLPITPTGDIDWNYMEQYITWIETRERESRKLRAAREEQILRLLQAQHT